MNRVNAYLWNLLIAVDQLLNIRDFGDQDETRSARPGKASVRCALCCAICRRLSRIAARHCEKSIEAGEGKNGIIK